MVLLNMGSDALAKWEISSYYGDGSLTQSNPVPESGGDAIIKKRYDRFSEGKRVKLYGPLLSSGVTQNSRAFPPLSDFKFVFRKNPETFHITKESSMDGTFFIQIIDFKIKLKRMIPFNSVLRSIETKINAGEE